MLLTDGAIHSLDYFDSYFSQIYTPRDTVTAATFADDVAKGLWTYNGAITLSDAESLVFRYYNNENALIKSQKITIVSNGKNAVVMTSESTPTGSYVGQLGMYAGHFYQWNGSEWVIQETVTLSDISDYTPKYLGCFESAPTANKGDWYILKTNGILYRYNGASWQAITDYSNSEYTRLFMAAMSDLFDLAKSTGEQVFAERIVATAGMIQTLFSNQIVIPTGGTISSESYSSGTSGFKIQGNGAAEFNQGTFNNITVNNGVFQSLKITYSGNILEYSAESSELNPKNLFSILTTKTGAQMFGAIAFHIDGEFDSEGYLITRSFYGIMVPTSFEFTAEKIHFEGLMFYNGILWSTSTKKAGYGELNIYPDTKYLNEGKINLLQGGTHEFTINRISFNIEY